jgi:PAS domain S-box-containing protein
MEHAPSGKWPPAAEALYRALLLDITDAALLFLDRAGYVLAAGAGAELLLGCPAEDIPREHYSQLFFRPEEVHRGEPEHDLHRGEVKGRVVVGRWYRRRDGTAFWGVGVLVPLRAPSGGVWAFALALRDLTPLKLLEWQPGPPPLGPVSDALPGLDGLLALVLSLGEGLLVRLGVT